MVDSERSASSEADHPGRLVRAVTERLGRELLRLIPHGADRVVYAIRALAPFSQAAAQAASDEGTRWQVRLPDVVTDAAEELRRVMYRPGAGTWFSAELTVTRDGSMEADFNYDDEPGWTRPVEPTWYAQDLRMFPRDEAAIPDWLRARLAQAGPGP